MRTQAVSICKVCQGTGRFNMPPFLGFEGGITTCHLCEGKGRSNLEPCEPCEATGRQNPTLGRMSKTCEFCEGRGFLYPDLPEGSQPPSGRRFLRDPDGGAGVHRKCNQRIRFWFKVRIFSVEGFPPNTKNGLVIPPKPEGFVCSNP